MVGGVVGASVLGGRARGRVAESVLEELCLEHADLLLHGQHLLLLLQEEVNL